MQQDIERFLNLKNPPGRLTREEAAWFLGFSPDEITILVSRGLLKPLGHPAANGQKFFLTAVLEELKRDEKWYTKATDAVMEYWRTKNSRKRRNPEDHQQNSPPSEDRAGHDCPRREAANIIA